MRTFKIPTRPYEDNTRLYLHNQVTFNPGLTTLVGCNGSGKTTLMGLIHAQLHHDRTVIILRYDDRKDGGSHLMDEYGFHNDLSSLASMMLSSEGEKIMQGIGDFVLRIRPKIRKYNPAQVWILLDAVGSGLSVDGIADIKDLCEVIIEDNPDREVYFVVSTNEYEFTIGADCIDVTTFKHLTFNDYDEYKQFIMSTRLKKDRRYKK